MAFDEATVWFPPSTLPYVFASRILQSGQPQNSWKRLASPLAQQIQTVSTSWNEADAQRGEAPAECIDLTLERVLLTASNDIAFISLHRHRSALACFRIDLPTTNQTGDTRFILASL